MTLPDPEGMANMDQAMAIMADHWPVHWHRLYEGCLRAGFGDTESFKLVQTYILSQCVYGIRGSDG